MAISLSISEQQSFHKKSDTPAVKLRFFDVSTKDSLLAAAFMPEEETLRLKLKSLERLGIVPMDGEKPLHAWLRVMSEENGLPFTLPAHREIVDAIMYSSASKFVLFLA